MDAGRHSETTGRKRRLSDSCKRARLDAPMRPAHPPIIRCWLWNRRWIFSGWNESIAVGATPVVAQNTGSYLTQTGLAPSDKNWEEKRGGGPPFGLLPLRCMPLGYSVYSGPPSATISGLGVRRRAGEWCNDHPTTPRTSWRCRTRCAHSCLCSLRSWG